MGGVIVTGEGGGKAEEGISYCSDDSRKPVANICIRTRAAIFGVNLEREVQ